MRFISGLLVLLAVLAISTASAQNVTYYLAPVDNSVPDCTSTQVELRINTHGLDVAGGQIGLTYDASCANVTDVVFDSWLSPSPFSSWNYPNWNKCWDKDGIGTDIDWIIWQDMFSNQNGDLLICTFTISCSDPSGNCDYCVTDLSLTCGEDCYGCPILACDLDGNIMPSNISDDNGGTFTCGTPSPAETFSKLLYEGWNLISLPLDPEDKSADAVLSTVSYDAVYRYDATSKQFESVVVMNPGTGYFIHATADCTWEYSGTPYTSMDVSLKQGLNMVGWLNCTKDVDALSLISDYYYVARWDATAEKFEVYTPMAPAASFHDFTAMDRGTGYFISAKQDCTLSESC